MSNKYTGRDGEICRNCAYYIPVPNLDLSRQQGECRRFPPTPLLKPFQGGVGISNEWTQVLAATWCGEGQHPEATP